MYLAMTGRACVDNADVAVQRDLPWELDSTLRTLGRTNLGDTLGTGSDPPNFGSHIRTFRQDQAKIFTD